MNQPRTICVKCRHHLDRTDLLVGAHLCGHPSLVRGKSVDPVTGETQYRVWARLYVSRPMTHADRVHPDCNEINDGECPFYEEKPCEL